MVSGNNVEDPELQRRFTEEFQRLEGVPVNIDLDALGAWIVVSNLQLALRHPKNTGPSAKIARAITKRMIDAIAPPGTALREVAERGWNPKYDVKGNGGK